MPLGSAPAAVLSLLRAPGGHGGRRGSETCENVRHQLTTMEETNPWQ